ncbi:ATP-binding protein [Catellatospora sp. NEAU-YM18]|nr:AAA family ATPase [Catellatospora tritici]MBV1854554.1 ATP-binding protein [Catellatospora tritici]
MFGTDVSDDLADPAVFEQMDELVQQRLLLGLPAVVDATNVTSQARLRMIAWSARIGNPVWVARFTADLATVLAQNAGRAKVIPADVVTRYAEIMAEQATDEQLISEGIDRIIDVPGLREATTPREAVRLAFPDHILRTGFHREAHEDG